MDDNPSTPKPQVPPSDILGLAPPQERPFVRDAPQSAAGPNVDLSAIAYALFKHKWKILACSTIGFLMAAAVHVAVKPEFQSEAKLLVKYVQDDRIPIGVTQDTSEIKRISDKADSIINTEIEILSSMDIAEKVVAKVGPERILSDPAAASESHIAAQFLRKNLIVALPNNKSTSVLRVSFAHTDPTVAQAVVREVVATYLSRHVEIHRQSSEFDTMLTEEIDTRRATLRKMEDDLRKLRIRAGTDSIPEARRIFAAQIAKLQDDMMSTETALAENRAAFAIRTGRAPEVIAASSDAPETPPEKVGEYQRVTGILSSLAQREREYLLQYTSESLVVRGVRTQIAENERIKSGLEAAYPALRGTAIAQPIPATGQALPVFDRAGEEAKIVQLETRKRVVAEQIAAARADAAALSEIEPFIIELERATELEKGRYVYFVTNRDQRETERKLTNNMNMNILEIQEPSTPVRVPGVQLKLMAAFLFAGIAAGLAIAFGLEFFVDHSVRRTREIEGALGLPLFFSIPDLKELAKHHRGGTSVALPKFPSVENSEGSAPPWSPAHGMRSFFDGLRDRLVFYFEIRNVTRKPKLIAVAGCGENSGVSTIASGLAASLSESGDGNVLLVDMNPGKQTPFHFHKGELKCGLDDVLESDKRDDAMVRENLYVVSHSSGQEKLNSILPRRFTKLVPKLKASDYDYIIFDLPPVNHTSATPQLARYMDMTLMVVASETTARETAKRVGTLFADAGVNFGVVLNKTREYVPRSVRSILSADS